MAGFEILKVDPLVGRHVWVVDDVIQHEARAFADRYHFNGYVYAYSRPLPYVAAGAS